MPVRTVDDIMADMQAIMDAADGAERQMTDDEVTRYEAFEAELIATQRRDALRGRHNAYGAPAGAMPAAHHPAGIPKADNGLELAFEAYLRTGQANQDITQLKASQGEGTGAGGGYTVPQGFQQKIVERMVAYGGFAPNAEQLNTTTGAPLEYPTVDDTANSGTITAESAAATGGADIAFGKVDLGAYKYTSSGANDAPVRVPVELAQDSAFNIQGLVSRLLGVRIARKQAAHWVTGTGVSQPKGILAASLTADRDLDTADTPDYEDLVDLTDLLDEAYEPNAAWLMRKNTWSQLRLIVDGNGRPIVQDSTAGIGQKPQRLLLGAPVIIDPAVPVLSSAGDTYCMAYGDFREAYIIRRVASLVVVVNPFTRAQYGEVEYTAWQRADGNIQNRNAYVIMQNNT